MALVLPTPTPSQRHHTEKRQLQRMRRGPCDNPAWVAWERQVEGSAVGKGCCWGPGAFCQPSPQWLPAFHSTSLRFSLSHHPLPVLGSALPRFFPHFFTEKPSVEHPRSARPHTQPQGPAVRDSDTGSVLREHRGGRAGQASNTTGQC